ncbi:uncharacterized protein LOC124434063 [Xenia sp. Carnegie-2017]|uniref:uncharacterized protein LOC124434063 n=1 Tax=Xenia sp. Carnegie-2017 TaxID=2897299 RepID=UPI001F038910|nr:uncharacterized protein LOC124434063 [Xenia sp. Carnegie-2017]
MNTVHILLVAMLCCVWSIASRHLPGEGERISRAVTKKLEKDGSNELEARCLPGLWCNNENDEVSAKKSKPDSSQDYLVGTEKRPKENSLKQAFSMVKKARDAMCLPGLWCNRDNEEVLEQKSNKRKLSISQQYPLQTEISSEKIAFKKPPYFAKQRRSAMCLPGLWCNRDNEEVLEQKTNKHKLSLSQQYPSQTEISSEKIAFKKPPYFAKQRRSAMCLPGLWCNRDNEEMSATKSQQYPEKAQ